MSATDRQRMLELLREAGDRGVHTHDLRRLGVSGNPSQRATDLEQLDGCMIRRVRERRGRRPGSRFFLVSEPREVARDPVPAGDPGGTLFDEDVGRMLPAHDREAA